MAEPFVDTDAIVRLLAGDDEVKQAASRALFERVEAGALTLRAPVTVIADAVHVLGSRRLYNIPRAELQEMLGRLVRLPGFHVDRRSVVLRALAVYGARNVDFGDAMLIAAMEAEGANDLYSYDRGFDRVGTINRKEP